MLVFESDRTFEARQWRPGHGGFLLRSWVRTGDTTRIEVHFKPAAHVCLPATLDGLRIEDATKRQRRRVGRVPGVELTGHYNVFMVSSGDEPKGWVIAMSVFGLRDRQEFSAPTMFTYPRPAGTEDLFSHMPDPPIPNRTRFVT